MGWRDRDYARGSRGGLGGWSPAAGIPLIGGSVVTTLIAVNVAVFVLCSVTSGRSVLESPVFQWSALHTPSVLRGQIWRLITAQYLHWGFGHVLMNMLGLHFLGRALEREWGPKRFLLLYTLAGTLGNVFYVVLTLIDWLSLQGVAAGASGCVLALLGVCAVRFPRAEVLIYFLFPIRIRTAAMLFGGWYVLNLLKRGENAGGDACHLAGLAFGTWWAMRGERWWDRLRWRPTVGRSKPRSHRPSRFVAGVEQRREDADTIDRILKKVYEGGIHTLTEPEKRALADATERQRRADAEKVDGL